MGVGSCEEYERRVMERSQDWIYEAKKDLEHAKNDLASGFYNWACFSAQQGAEKAIKVVFKKMGAEAWGHSVAGLLKELSAKAEIKPALLEAGQELDKAYISSRYPDALPAGTPSQLYNRKEAERLIRHGDKIVEFCSNLLSQIK